MKTWIMPATVLSAHDGDTFKAEFNVLDRFFVRWDIRVDGCDAPEISTDAGKAALAWLGENLPVGTGITITFTGTEKYGRILGAVMLADGRNLTEAIIAAGHAVPYAGTNRNARLAAQKVDPKGFTMAQMALSPVSTVAPPAPKRRGKKTPDAPDASSS